MIAFFGALIGRLMAAELYAWAPALADWLLRFYVRSLPEKVGERLLEEWQALLFDTPGNLGKLLVALSLGVTMLPLKAEAREAEYPCKSSASLKAEISLQAKESIRRDLKRAFALRKLEERGGVVTTMTEQGEVLVKFPDGSTAYILPNE